MCLSIKAYEDGIKAGTVASPHGADYVPVVLTQVKEKFGTLRVYYEGGDDFMRTVVEAFESMSSVTCEMCGTRENTYMTNGWISVRCEPCLVHEGKTIEGRELPLS